MAARGPFRSLLIALPAAGLLLWLGAAVGAAQDLPSVLGNPARGGDVFVAKGCIACHAVRGAGGQAGPDLAAALVGKGIVGIAAAMLNHYPGMRGALQHADAAPARITPGEMDDLVAYLLFINFAHEAGSVDNGRDLFSQKGCTRCHRTTGGASIGPPLGRATLSAPPLAVAQDMWNHGTQMTAKMRELQVPPSTFEKHEMADLLAFLTGPAEPLPSSRVLLPGDPLVGRDLFQSKGCARCHREEPGGESIGPVLVTERWYKTATEIAGAMWNHGPNMWARMTEMGITPPRLEGDEMAHLVAYLYLAQSAGGPGVAERGRQIFAEKHCAHCHETGGSGPDLTIAEQLDTPIHFAAEMWNHAARMHTFVTEAGYPWPVFSASDVRDVVSYLGARRAAGR